MSVRKANKFIIAAKESGWETRYQILSSEDQVIQVTATRGAESVTIEWANNRLSFSPEYKFHDMELKLHSTIEAVRAVQRHKPDLDRYGVWLRRTRRKSKAVQNFTDPLYGNDEEDRGEVPPETQNLPFNIKEDSDLEILKAISGNTIVYRHGISGAVSSVLVPWRLPGGRKGMRLMNRDTTNVFYLALGKEDRVYLSFMDSEGQFRAIYIDQMIGVA